MKELLYSVREALFDAPSEVKESFNKVVEYFAKDKVTPDPSKLKVEMDDFSRKYFTDDQWKSIIAASLYQFPYITEISVKRNDDYSYSNERRAPSDWKPKYPGIEISIKYEGRKTNRDNNLTAALVVRDAVEGLERSYLSSADHLYLYHRAADKSSTLNIHYPEDKKRLVGPTYLHPYDENKTKEVAELAKRVKL